jgi:pyridoxamine 5'-phosphate oxidase
MTLADLRNDYGRLTLDERDLDPDPIRQFDRWFAEAHAADVAEANAMTLATASPDGRPSARIVLLRGCDPQGFTFFTNHDSRKGRELDANPRAALVFYWRELERQVRVEGAIERVSTEESDEYFRSRPFSSRIGAWASDQSQVLPNREALEARCREIEAKYPDGEVPRPVNWGGYRVVPESIEFWQGRPSRLHDRLRYRKNAEGAWTIERLNP